MGSDAPTLGQLTDPFDVDPVTKEVNKFLTDYIEHPGAVDMVTHALENKTPDPQAPLQPTPENAGSAADRRIKKDIGRLRASRTLFTSGSGIDTPNTASTVLLGS